MSTKGKYIIPIMELLQTKRGCVEKPVTLTMYLYQIDHPTPELNTCCIAIYVKLYQTGF
jgi:hypothetical protein